MGVIPTLGHHLYREQPIGRHEESWRGDHMPDYGMWFIPVREGTTPYFRALRNGVGQKRSIGRFETRVTVAIPEAEP